MVLGNPSQVAEVDAGAVDDADLAVPDGGEQCLGVAVSGGAVAAPGIEAGEVDEGLQREFRGGGVVRAGVVEDFELCPAQAAGEVRQAAVAGDQRTEVAGFGGSLEVPSRVSGCGVRQIGGLADADIERVAGGLGPGNEGEARWPGDLSAAGEARVCPWAACRDRRSAWPAKSTMLRVVALTAVPAVP